MQKTWMPKLAGILSIIAGSIGILGVLLVLIIINSIIASSYYPEMQERYLRNPAVWLIFAAFIFINIIAITGGVMAIKRRMWGFALAGSICSLLTIWGWVLGIASIIFIILSKNEFGLITTFLSAPDEHAVTRE